MAERPCPGPEHPATSRVGPAGGPQPDGPLPWARDPLVAGPRSRAIHARDARPGRSSGCPAILVGRVRHRRARSSGGKRIVPVHPTAPEVLGEQGYATVADIPSGGRGRRVRRSSAAGEFADRRLESGPAGVFQLGVSTRPRSAGPRRPASDGDGHLPGIEWRRGRGERRARLAGRRAPVTIQTVAPPHLLTVAIPGDRGDRIRLLELVEGRC